MKSRHKLTGFGRFIIFLIILAPIVYFGLQYLRSSGLLEIKKEETNIIEEDQTTAQSEKDILEDISKRSESTSSKEIEIISEQQRKIEELERENRELRNRTGDQNADRATLPPPPTSQTNGRGDGPTFDDILKEADDALRDKGTSEDTEAPKKSSATWTFSFSATSGEIELYEENGRIMARTVYVGNNRVDVSELVVQGDRLTVKDSPTGEYYILRSDGDLDAYDQNGFQTTCRRK